MKKYDLIVIGAGAAGLTAAYTAVGFGKKVALIDKNNPGGDCTWSGCVPSKTLIRLSKEFYTAKKFVGELQADTSLMMKKVREKIETIYEKETPEKLQSDGIDFVSGKASFIDSNTVEVNEKYYIGKKIIVCTGSRALIPPVEGIHSVPYLTNESFFKLKSLPSSITILGGGAIGIELAQALNRIGVKVTLIEMQDEILPHEDPEMAHRLHLHLSNEGVNIQTGLRATKVVLKDNNIDVSVEASNVSHTITAQSLLVAVGRIPNIEDLNLKNAGISFDKKGIIVDSHFATTNKDVFAAGDVCSKYKFSHVANFQAISAVKNALLPIKSTFDEKNIAWCTFTEPELAHSGLTEDAAREKYGNKFKKYVFDFNDNDRSVTEGKTLGFAKILTDNNGYIIGSSVLNERAGEIINEIQVARTNKIKLSKFANILHPYPTFGEFLNKLGKQALVDLLLDKPFVKLFRKK